ncbi:hypothetical protein EDC01DRAFT_630632 [Geopyxis carbonaria]|nr:hypothetical protein EDC01DRAFT_630632 [Geopyxis carbonaria]
MDCLNISTTSSSLNDSICKKLAYVKTHPLLRPDDALMPDGFTLQSLPRHGFTMVCLIVPKILENFVFATHRGQHGLKKSGMRGRFNFDTGQRVIRRHSDAGPARTPYRTGLDSPARYTPYGQTRPLREVLTRDTHDAVNIGRQERLRRVQSQPLNPQIDSTESGRANSSPDSSIPQLERLHLRRPGEVFGSGQVIFPARPLSQDSINDVTFSALRGSYEWRCNIQQWIDDVEVATSETEALSIYDDDSVPYFPNGESRLCYRTNDSQDDSDPLFFVRECPDTILRRQVELEWSIEKAMISTKLSESRQEWDDLIKEAGSKEVAFERKEWCVEQEQYHRMSIQINRPGNAEREPFEVTRQRRRRHAWEVLTYQTNSSFEEPCRGSESRGTRYTIL